MARSSTGLDLPTGVQCRSCYQTVTPISGGKAYEIHYMRWQDAATTDRTAEKPPVEFIICWHGLNRNGRDFDYIAARMAKAFPGVTVICPDTVGRGLSSWAPPEGEEGGSMADVRKIYSLNFYQKLVVELFKTAEGGAIAAAGEVWWLGTSMGGLIGMNYAATWATQQGGATTLPCNITRLCINDVGPVIPMEAIERIKTYASKPPVVDNVTTFEQFIRFAYKPFGIADDDPMWRHLAEVSCRRLNNGQITSHYDPRLILALSNPSEDEVKGGGGEKKKEEEQEEEPPLWPTWELFGKIKCPMLCHHGAQSDLLLPDVCKQMETTREGKCSAEDGVGAREVGLPRFQIMHWEGIGHALGFETEKQSETVINFFSQTGGSA